MVNTPGSTQPFILLKLIKRVRGTPGNWVVKKKNVQSLALWEEWGNPCSTPKIGLSSPAPFMFFPENAEFVVFIIFPKMSQPLPSQSIPNAKSWTWNFSWYHGFITQIFGETNNGGYHKILESIVMLFLFRNKC